MTNARCTYLTAEEEEFAEADAILQDLRQRIDAGESDLAWGDCLSRCWDDHGTLLVTRQHSVASPFRDPVLLRIREMPYSALPTAVGGTGGVVWGGAIALADQLSNRWEELVSGSRNVLEIGAGCGLPGLCAAALLDAGESASVTLTDESDAVLENLRFNVASNAKAFKLHVDVSKLVWEDVVAPHTNTSLLVKTVDVLLGSDVIWGERGPLVAQLARRLVRPEGCLLLTAQVGREGLDEFETVLCREQGDGPAFDVEKSHVKVSDEDIVIYYCRRGAATAATCTSRDAVR
eukprot:TRINITY_DN77044_c0_g1_i1.p1 TRINITY_DN77044_c0_g1~~TRINITY_DN77044_c0_g1_i1.p1  ORF type:complete len:311 (-),score=45.53 TRINITY_DN77044_c0_g1_i1:68-940(-)